MQPGAVSLLSADHAQAYRALMLEAYQLHPDAFTTTPADRALLPISWWRQRLGCPASDGEQVFGAFVDGELAGVAGLSVDPREKVRHKAHLFGMYVRERFRGQGLSRRLVDAVLTHARARPETVLVNLTVTEGNAVARRLYESCGFVSFGVEPMAVRVGESYLAKVHMWCRVR